MVRRLATVVILSALSMTACGSRQVIVGERNGPLGSVGAARPAAAGDQPALLDPSDFPTTTPSTRPGRAQRGDNGLGFGSGPGANNSMPLTVRLSRACVQPGQQMSATAVTLPASKLAFAAAYSDNDIVPDFTYTPAEANPTGTFTWTWVIRPSIPPGDAVVSVVAAKDGRGATFEQRFRVARAC